MPDSFDMEAYFDRILFNEIPTISIETLQALHIGHCLNVPFENLDIHMGREISLNIERLFHKIVRNRRGGYCFEMNGLFAHVLEELGFTVQRLVARVELRKRPEPRNHQIMLVHLEGRDWLVDVGFGGRGLIAPVPLEHGQVEKQFAETLRLTARKDDSWVLQTLIDEAWQDQYAFTLDPVLAIDYEPGNFYHSRSPDSSFTRRILCTLPTTEGFIYLANQMLTLISNGKTVTEKAMKMDDYYQLLKKHFDIELDAPLNPPWST